MAEDVSPYIEIVEVGTSPSMRSKDVVPITFFMHYLDGVKVLVPTPPFSDEEKLNNLSTYGSEYGVNRLPYMRGAGLYVDISSQTITIENIATFNQEQKELQT